MVKGTDYEPSGDDSRSTALPSVRPFGSSDEVTRRGPR